MLAQRPFLLILGFMLALGASSALPAHAQAGGAKERMLEAPAPTVLQAHSTPDSLTFGQLSAIAISGVVSVPRARLTLSVADGADRTQVAETTAAADGAFEFVGVVAPTSTTEYEVAYPGDDLHAPATVSITVSVLPIVTLLAPKTAWLAPGEAVHLRGVVTPAHPGGVLLIDRRLPDGTWRHIASATLDGDSHFALDITPEQFGTLTLRARTEAHADHGAGQSAVHEIVVNRRNRHRVAYKYAHYIVNVVREYKLYYYEHGALVRSFEVAFGRPGFRTPIGTFAIYHKRRPGGGALGSCAMFYRRAGGIAIHGTNQPGLLSQFPRPFSHGCTRMRNAEALWLYYRCPVGTPVRNVR